MRPMMLRALLALFSLACAGPGSVASAANLTVSVGFVSWTPDTGPVLSNVIPEPLDAGLQGAQLAVADNNSTGRFLNHDYQLLIAAEPELTATLDAAKALHSQGIRLFVTNLPAPALADLSEAFGSGSILINAGSHDDDLRSRQCLPNVLHTLPSRAMLADALAQFMTVRKLNRWLLITGPTADDKAYAQALERAAKRFGHRIIGRKEWTFNTDLRRAAQSEVPLFTQTDEYDVVVVADERGDFGEFIPYNTWYPRPVAGTQGLTPVGWHKVIESFGAAQLQKRFELQAGRWMNSLDFAAWLGVRTYGAAVTTLNTTDPAAILALSLSDKLPLDGFKGRKLSYRDWSGQLRQPIALVHPRALVTNSPQEGFLHPFSELDTLGFDRPESTCRLL